MANTKTSAKSNSNDSKRIKELEKAYHTNQEV